MPDATRPMMVVEHFLGSGSPRRFCCRKLLTALVPPPTGTSTLKTLALAPLMVIGAMPETNEIEVSIWGGANRPYISPNSSEIITFTIESCELQVLNAQVSS